MQKEERKKQARTCNMYTCTLRCSPVVLRRPRSSRAAGAFTCSGFRAPGTGLKEFGRVLPPPLWGGYGTERRRWLDLPVATVNVEFRGDSSSSASLGRSISSTSEIADFEVCFESGACASRKCCLDDIVVVEVHFVVVDTV